MSSPIPRFSRLLNFPQCQVPLVLTPISYLWPFLRSVSNGARRLYHCDLTPPNAISRSHSTSLCSSWTPHVGERECRFNVLRTPASIWASPQGYIQPIPKISHPRGRERKGPQENSVSMNTVGSLFIHSFFQGGNRVQIHRQQYVCVHAFPGVLPSSIWNTLPRKAVHMRYYRRSIRCCTATRRCNHGRAYSILSTRAKTSLSSYPTVFVIVSITSNPSPKWQICAYHRNGSGNFISFYSWFWTGIYVWNWRVQGGRRWGGAT